MAETAEKHVVFCRFQSNDFNAQSIPDINPMEQHEKTSQDPL